jgi:hypothetical protein
VFYPSSHFIIKNNNNKIIIIMRKKKKFAGKNEKIDSNKWEKNE